MNYEQNIMYMYSKINTSFSLSLSLPPFPLSSLFHSCIQFPLNLLVTPLHTSKSQEIPEDLSPSSLEDDWNRIFRLHGTKMVAHCQLTSLPQLTTVLIYLALPLWIFLPFNAKTLECIELSWRVWWGQSFYLATSSIRRSVFKLMLKVGL